MAELPEDDLLGLAIQPPLIYHGIGHETLQVSLEVLKNRATERVIHTQVFFVHLKHDL